MNFHKTARYILWIVFIFMCPLAISNALANDKTQVIYVAVASDFLNTFKQIANQFSSKTPYRIVISSGATNTIFMQIQHGAPYDIFFSADSLHPNLLNQSGLTIPGKNYIYAVGKLVLWAPNKSIVNSGKDYLNSDNYNHLAIANPKLAPYGLAAMEALNECVKLKPALSKKIIFGENANQTFNFVATKNADAGFVGLAQIMYFKKQSGQKSTNDVWLVPSSCYKPIKQEVVLLKNAKDKSVAFELLDFFKQAKVQQLIAQAGYSLSKTTD